MDSVCRTNETSAKLLNARFNSFEMETQDQKKEKLRQASADNRLKILANNNEASSV